MNLEEKQRENILPSDNMSNCLCDRELCNVMDAVIALYATKLKVRHFHFAGGPTSKAQAS